MGTDTPHFRVSTIGVSIMTIQKRESDYRSAILDEPTQVEFEGKTYDSPRQFVEALATPGISRVTYYAVKQNPLHVLYCNESTRETIWHAPGTVLDAQMMIDVIGAKLVKPEPKLDDNSEPICDEDGKPVLVAPTEYAIGFKVTVEGFQDCEGNPIPKGMQRFVATKQPTNRPLTVSNVDDLESNRLPTWAYNGETMILDQNGMGASVQHRGWAIIKAELTGSRTSDDIPIISDITGGVHPILSMTIDTGKANTGRDIFGSDPEIVPEDVLLTKESYSGITDEPVYRSNRIGLRKTVCGELQSAAKMMVNRLAGRQIGASTGSANVTTELAHNFTRNNVGDLDDLTAMSDAYLSDFKRDAKPTTTPILTAVLGLWYLSDEERIGVDPKRGGRPLDEVGQIHFDLDRVVPFLNDLAGYTVPGSPLNEWGVAMAKFKGSKNEKFGILVNVVKAYMRGDEVTKDYCTKTLEHGFGEQNGKTFSHFGGADCGPIEVSRKKKSDDTDE